MAIAQLSAESFVRFAAVITREIGIKMPAAKLATLQNRLLKRMRQLQLHSFGEYEEFLLRHREEEKVHFFDIVTTNKTGFFREPAHFEYLERVVLPGLINVAAGTAREMVKCWSVGCSTGEEPYTIAMVLEEYSRRCRPISYAVLATDVSTRVLEDGRKGVYEASLVSPIPSFMRRLYLGHSKDKTKTLMRVCPVIRSRVSFRHLNLIQDHFGVKDRFQVIFFRNVMIYFEKAMQESVIRKLCRHLAPGGYLITGHSESVLGLDVPLKQVKASIYRKL